MDDLISKLSDILSSPEGAQRIKELLSLAGAGTAGSADADGGTTYLKPAQSTTGFNPNSAMLMAKMSEMFSVMNDPDDSRVNLLTSLRPFMSQKRSSHLDSAVKMLQITKLSGLINGKNRSGG